MDNSKYVENVVRFLESKFPIPKINFQTDLEKITYYTTKYFVKLPNNIEFELNQILLKNIQSKPIINVKNFYKTLNDNLNPFSIRGNRSGSAHEWQQEPYVRTLGGTVRLGI